MHVTQFDFLSSSVEMIIFVVALFSLLRTSNTLIIPIRFPVRICSNKRMHSVDICHFAYRVCVCDMRHNEYLVVANKCNRRYGTAVSMLK